MEELKQLLEEIIEEARIGKVTYQDEEWPIAFNTIIEGREFFNEDNLSTLVINDLDSLIFKIQEYLIIERQTQRKSPKYLKDDRELNKVLITSLLTNATINDLSNPEEFIDRYIDFLKDESLAEYSIERRISLDNILANHSIIIKDKLQDVRMETPHKLEISIVSDEDPNLVFKLPEISYGISNGECFVYSILNKETDDTKYKKKISRKLYKMNTDVMENESEEFIAYRNNESDYYPENITDVSMSSVLSLYIFMKVMENKVTKIKGVPYLPIRYNSRSITAERINDKEKRQALEERNDIIQYNITNKFIRTFNRAIAHTDFMNVDTYPYESDEFITCSYKSRINMINNDIVETISRNMH